MTTNAAIHPSDSDKAKNLKSTAYEAACGGDAVTGLKLPFGCQVYYKPPKPQELPDLEPRTYPSIFVGRRVDFGYIFRGIHLSSERIPKVAVSQLKFTKQSWSNLRTDNGFSLCLRQSNRSFSCSAQEHPCSRIQMEGLASRR